MWVMCSCRRGVPLLASSTAVQLALRAVMVGMSTTTAGLATQAASVTAAAVCQRGACVKTTSLSTMIEHSGLIAAYTRRRSARHVIQHHEQQQQQQRRPRQLGRVRRADCWCLTGSGASSTAPRSDRPRPSRRRPSRRTDIHRHVTQTPVGR